MVARGQAGAKLSSSDIKVINSFIDLSDHASVLSCLLLKELNFCPALIGMMISTIIPKTLYEPSIEKMIDPDEHWSAGMVME